MLILLKWKRFIKVSVLILSFMSMERYVLIAAPLKGHRTMTPQTASTSVIIIWIIGITLALAPGSFSPFLFVRES